MTRELTSFVLGWRGFLVGNRRSWHAHHRWGVLGDRAGNLVAAPAVQTGQLRSFVGLMTEVFARGGTLWAFGVVGSPRTTWGRAYAWWRPGLLSNYFFARLRRIHFARHLGRLWRGRRRRRRRWRRRVSTRAGRLYRTRPGGWTRRAARVVAAAAAAPRLARAARPGGSAAYRGGPRAGRRRTRWFRRWWVVAPRLFVSPRRVDPPGRPGVARARRRTARAIRRAQLVRLGRTARAVRRPVRAGLTSVARPPARRGVDIPHRAVSRFQRWPVPFPTVLLGAGLTLLKSTLLNEVTAAGVPLVRLGGVDLVFRPGVLELFWNTAPAATAGVPPLVNDLFHRACRVALFRVFWRRLGVPR